MNFTLASLIEILSSYGYAIIFPIAILEGPLVAIAAGLLVSRGILAVIPTTLILIAGDLLGDTFYYSLGRYGGRNLGRRWGNYIGVTEERVEKLEHYFKNNDWKLILFSKTQAIGATILFSAGVVKMKFRRFIGFNFIGSIPKAILFQLIGYYFGESTSEANLRSAVSYAGIGSFVIAGLLLGSYILMKRYLQKHNAFPTE